ncbi:CHAT domain-containing protein [Reichenbachiella versicolor]|uniref:CHAT domain-containing protein n=1 Tax=Reichenbachiella versicolor TaxID=1821036 RepID=UPI000D6E6E23|nr:CHAT domain-containing protein [Reichenbachiella versicolor]
MLKTTCLSIVFTLIFLSGQAQIDLADRHYEQGDEFLLYNKHDSSVYHFEKAREIYLKESYWRGVVASDNKISENLCGTFELDEALRLAQEAFDMAKEYLGAWDIERANALNNIGNIHYLTGRHELALKEYEEALKIANHEVHDEVLFSAPTSLGIGNVYFGKHQYEEAFRHFQTALESNIRILGKDHPYVANSYLSLGNLYRNKGSYNLATQYYEKALSINKKAFGENHPDVATTYVGIADIYKTSGQNDLALQYYRQALVIYQMFLHEMNPKYGAIFLGFADIYKNKSNYDKSLEYYQKAVNLFEQTIGLEHQSTVRAYLGMGNVYMYQERFREALDYYNKVMEVNWNLVGENHVNTARVNNNLGSIYYFFGDFELSIRYCERALKIDKAIHGNTNPDVAADYYQLARIYGETGRIQEALNYCQEAINSSIIDFEEKNIFVNPVLTNFFNNYELMLYMSYKAELLEEGFSRSKNVKGLDVSLNSFVKSDSLVEQIRQTYYDRRDQIQLSKLSSKVYESSVNASYALMNLISPSNVSYISPDATYKNKKAEYENRFFYFTEKKKGAILFSSLAESNAKSFGGLPDELLDREIELKEIINSYTQELSANPDSAMLEYYQRELFKANRQYEELIERMEHDYPKYYDLKYDVSVTPLEDIKSFLDDSTMMLSYFLTSDSIYIAQIDNQEMRIEKRYKKKDYDRSVKAIRKGVLFKSNEIYLRYAREMYEQLFPKDVPDRIKNIIIVQDGIMATIPFELLLTENFPNSDNIDFSKLPYLVRDYNLSYTFSANLLYKTFKNEKLIRAKADQEGMVLAPVTFGHAVDALKNAKKKSYDDDQKAYNLRRGINMPTSELIPLPGTEIEVLTIDSIFHDNGKIADEFIYYDAKEEVAKSGEMGKYKYIHIASHGFVNQDEPEFSGIMLTMDTLTNEEDGILFSGEIYNIDLNAELVTLSACETGLGRIETGQGIIGLTRALIYAGAKNLTVSLWKVSDASTKDLMINYYKNFLPFHVPKEFDQSLSYSYALRKAKLKMIDQGGQFAHPYYWSPFVLMGK